MRKIFGFLLIAVFLISLASAQITYLYDDIQYKEKITQTTYYDNEIVTRTIYADYDNDDRYSTSSYKYGYSYRDTESYWNSDHKDYFRNYDNYPTRNSKYSSQKSYYSVYNPTTKYNELRECYVRPPKNKLFYIRCP